MIITGLGKGSKGGSKRKSSSVRSLLNLSMLVGGVVCSTLGTCLFFLLNSPHCCCLRRPLLLVPPTGPAAGGNEGFLSRHTCVTLLALYLLTLCALPSQLGEHCYQGFQYLLFSAAHIQWGRKIMICVAFFSQILLPNLHNLHPHHLVKRQVYIPSKFKLNFKPKRPLWVLWLLWKNISRFEAPLIFLSLKCVLLHIFLSYHPPTIFFTIITVLPCLKLFKTLFKTTDVTYNLMMALPLLILRVKKKENGGGLVQSKPKKEIGQEGNRNKMLCVLEDTQLLIKSQEKLTSFYLWGWG